MSTQDKIKALNSDQKGNHQNGTTNILKTSVIEIIENRGKAGFVSP
jgi:hypothetical protein